MLHSIQAPSLQGEQGLAQLRQLQKEMAKALGQCDFQRVRQLDGTCAVVIDKLIAANRNDGRLGQAILLRALSDLKGVYANLIRECEGKADSVSQLRAGL